MKVVTMKHDNQQRNNHNQGRPPETTVLVSEPTIPASSTRARYLANRVMTIGTMSRYSMRYFNRKTARKKQEQRHKQSMRP